MGNNASRPSDLFYPDNPNRRVRVRQLRDDVQSFCNEFNEIEKYRDKILSEMKPRLCRLLEKYGYGSPEELDIVVQKTLEGSALKEYRNYKKRINEHDILVSTLFQITSVISVTSGIFLGGLVALGIMTGGMALATVKTIRGALAVSGASALFFEEFEGVQERSNMRKCIKELYYKRFEARKALEEMKAISGWIESILFWLNEPQLSENEEITKKKFEGNFGRDFDKSKAPYVLQCLEIQDLERGAWTNEDPPSEILNISNKILHLGIANPMSFSNIAGLKAEEASLFISDKPRSTDSTSKIKLEYQNEKNHGYLELTFLTSDKTSCTAFGIDDDKWTITYESGMDVFSDLKGLNSKSLKFTLRSHNSGVLFEGCRLNILSYTVS